MKLPTTAALASLALTTPAFAADLLGAAPPMTVQASQAPTAIEIGSGWYLRGDIGASFESGPIVSSAAVALPSPSPTAFSASASGANGVHFDGGLGFGYRFSDYLRFDATWDARTGPGFDRSATVVCPYGLQAVSTAGYLYDAAQTCNGALSLRENANTFLANAYVDLGDWNGLAPYIGGGLGLTLRSISGNANYYETANGPPYAANLAAAGVNPLVWVNGAGTPIAPQPAIPFAQQYWNRAIRSSTAEFAWALAAGVSYRLSPSVLIDVGYRLLDSGSPLTTINAATGTTIRQSAVSQQVRIGVRYLIQ